MSNQIYVRGLRDVHQKDVRNEFARYGPIADLQIHKDYGFIVSAFFYLTLFQTFKDNTACKDAIHGLDGRRVFSDERIKVELARKSGNERGERGDRGDRGDRSDRPRGGRDGGREPRGGERGRGPSSGDKCFNCGNTGHW